ncbi:hypothetical protein [Mycobacterium sp. 852002-51152_SCH6134967]|uniref:hypothetical protein n=1 Tax=Mycobacterium sp. 852002-51152_SCH6134967 TaxID=1834096 RepID=UPI0012E80DE0|nr:hypothetical protein [Mycobacterium sp. 852002-51152_SCH6134967]
MNIATAHAFRVDRRPAAHRRADVGVRPRRRGFVFDDLPGRPSAMPDIAEVIKLLR